MKKIVHNIKRLKNDWLIDLNRMWPDATRMHKIWYTMLDPGTKSVLYIRIQYLLTSCGFGILARIISAHNHKINGIDVVLGSKIGPGLVIRHPTGIVIGTTTVIGDNVTIMHGVTFGQHRMADVPVVNPRVGNGVSIGANAVLLGNIRIGDGAQIGAASVVLSDVDVGATVVGNPARSISRK